MQATTKVLVALMPEYIQPISQVVPGSFDMTFTTSLNEAQSLLDSSRFDVIVCGAHFDGCRMFDLLRYAKSTLQTRDIPFLCVRAVGGALDRTLYEGVKIASMALGAAGFVDLYRLNMETGEAEGLKKMRQLIEQMAAGQPLDI
ncbi:hypothetical protein [Noviherbaspirillum massiliense]|uniref:hypothetical protein n=1 Tax=Noviherbaspirillum massiliense TaxID=1465823 RepID=UPI00030AB2A4|nr:hypothetical protein [Noviherbaspirillum massiliense]